MIQDLRIAFRALVRSPGFLAASVLSLALAIGASVAAFAVIDAIRFRALPFPDADRLVVIGEVPMNTDAARLHSCELQCNVSYTTYADFLRATSIKSLDQVAAFTSGAKALNTGGDAIVVNGGVVTSNVFAMLQARPLVGRTFTEQDNSLSAPLTTVLSYGLWSSQFAKDPNIVGRDIKLSDSHYTVIGVMPEGFRFEVNSDFWLASVPTLDPSTKPSIKSVTVIGHLASGRTLPQLRAELANLKLPSGPNDAGSMTLAVSPLRSRYTSSAASHDLIFGAVVACVLLIACANLANLTLVRTVHQRREHSIRAALGADARQLARTVLLQNGLIVSMAAFLGVMLAIATLGVLRSLPSLSSLRPAGMDYQIDVRVVAFALVIALLAACFISIIPARLVVRSDVQQLLRSAAKPGGAGISAWMQKIFVVAQVACATVLLTGALLMAQTVLHYSGVELGFDQSQLLSASPSFPHSWRTREIYLPITQRIVRELGAMPNVAAVAVRSTSLIPVVDGAPSLTVGDATGILGRSLVPSQITTIGAGYFNAVGVRVTAGREFTEHDDERSIPVAMVNVWAAKRWFPNQDPIGRTIRIAGKGGATTTLNVVGVVADNKAARPNLMLADDGPELYQPFLQSPSAFPVFLVRTRGQPSALVRPVRTLLTTLVPDRPLFTAIASETATQQLGGVRSNALQITGFALVGLLLAIIGVYGVLAFETSRRTREIGIRSALGATRFSIAGMVLRDASRLAGVGVAIGLPAAFLATRLIRSLLYSTNPTDPRIYALVALIVLTVSALAGYGPARRASRVSPLIAMRME